MNKKFFILIFAALLVSCAEKEIVSDISQSQDNEISFGDPSIGIKTRATEIALPGLKNIGFDIRAYRTDVNGRAGTSYFNTMISDNVWWDNTNMKWVIGTGLVKYYWPTSDEKNQFYGWANAVSSQDLSTQFVAPTTTSAVARNPSFSYSLQNVAAQDQTDLLVVNETDKTKPTIGGVIQLPFYHALTQINFSVRSSEDNTQIRVKSITLSGVRYSGTFTYANTDDPNGHGHGEWVSNAIGTQSYSVPCILNHTLIPGDAVAPGTYYNTFAASGASLMLIPKNANNVQLDIVYEGFNASGVSITGELSRQVVIDASEWDTNEKIMYRMLLPFDQTEIEIEADVQEWENVIWNSLEQNIVDNDVTDATSINTFLTSTMTRFSALAEMTESQTRMIGKGIKASGAIVLGDLNPILNNVGYKVKPNTKIILDFSNVLWTAGGSITLQTPNDWSVSVNGGAANTVPGTLNTLSASGKIELTLLSQRTYTLTAGGGAADVTALTTLFDYYNNLAEALPVGIIYPFTLKIKGTLSQTYALGDLSNKLMSLKLKANSILTLDLSGTMPRTNDITITRIPIKNDVYYGATYADPHTTFTIPSSVSTVSFKALPWYEYTLTGDVSTDGTNMLKYVDAMNSLIETGPVKQTLILKGTMGAGEIAFGDLSLFFQASKYTTGSSVILDARRVSNLSAINKITWVNAPTGFTQFTPTPGVTELTAPGTLCFHK